MATGRYNISAYFTGTASLYLCCSSSQLFRFQPAQFCRAARSCVEPLKETAQGIGVINTLFERRKIFLFVLEIRQSLVPGMQCTSLPYRVFPTSPTSISLDSEASDPSRMRTSPLKFIIGSKSQEREWDNKSRLIVMDGYAKGRLRLCWLNHDRFMGKRGGMSLETAREHVMKGVIKIKYDKIIVLNAKKDMYPIYVWDRHHSRPR